jgi:hypothetical protein
MPTTRGRAKFSFYCGGDDGGAPPSKLLLFKEKRSH